MTTATARGAGTFEDPFCDIWSGIEAALPGDTVIVRDGVYTGIRNVGLSFLAKSFTLRSENGPENCIIDCGGNGRGFVASMNETRECVLDGFTITNGYDWIWGGGAFCDNADPTVTNCVFRDNHAGGFPLGSLGGGMVTRTHGSPFILNCLFEDNSAGIGGGLYIGLNGATVEVQGCTFRNNVSGEGGGGVCVQETNAPRHGDPAKLPVRRQQRRARKPQRR